MFVAANRPEALKTQETPAERMPALLVAGSLALAHQAAVLDWDWKSVGLHRFQTAKGEEVHAVADRFLSTLTNGQRGTRVYLGPGWYEREDLKTLNILLHSGILVEADPPNSGGR